MLGTTLAHTSSRDVLVYMERTQQASCWGSSVEVIFKLFIENLDISFRTERFKVAHSKALENGIFARWAVIATRGIASTQVT